MILQSESTLSLPEYSTHVANMGKLVEDMEFKIRHSLQEIYFGKTKDITNDLRSLNSLEETRKQQKLQAQLIGEMK